MPLTQNIDYYSHMLLTNNMNDTIELNTLNRIIYVFFIIINYLIVYICAWNS